MIETGGPYILAKDAVNRNSNQQNVGVVKSSNLCVAGDTRILTSKGQLHIGALVDQEVEVWNGQEYSSVTVRQTGREQDLVRVSFSNGMTLDCTPYHRFKVQSSYHARKPMEVRACDLQRGAMLAKCSFPVIHDGETWPSAYTHGFFCGDGFYHGNGQPAAWLYGALQHHLDIECLTEYKDEMARSYVRFDRSLPPKLTVPINGDLKTKLSWLAGWLDADGCKLVHKDVGTTAIQGTSVRLDFMQDIKLMLQTMGVDVHVTLMRPERRAMMPAGKRGHALYDCQAIYRMSINNASVNHLVNLGLPTHRLEFRNRHLPDRCAAHFVKVLSVEPLPGVHDTFCFNEPKTHTGVFGGIYSMNCAEIVEYSSPDEIAVCTLASISLPAFVKSNIQPEQPAFFDHQHLHDVAKLVTRNLNRVIDVGFLPVAEARYSNQRNRPIGIGTQGLADAFAILRMPFDSDDARQLNMEIAETIYHASMEASNELAAEQGSYDTFSGSPLSQGKFQFDLWGVTPSDRYNWDELRGRVMEKGARNSLLVAHMPTASTSQLLNNTESNEAFTSMIFSRKTLSGEHVVVNRHLVADLQKLGVWSVELKDSIVQHEGSIQHLQDQLPKELLQLYRTIWEIKQRSIIDMAADRGPYVCQSQSMNLYFAEPNTRKIGSAIFHGWRRGLKTLVYYTRLQAAAKAVPVTLAKREVDCASCSA